ncbi:MAG: hypothetical protein F6K36_17140 [Symploca sp. SIO3C6]|nr:hypothetical protein [Symploca sp. SIO3C6]NET03508.1 hypothetical protein [Symploca sp. SIO2B6]
MLDIALRDAQRLYQLLQDLLTLSKLEQGQVYHRRESLELQQALDLVLEEALLRMLELHQGEPKPYLWREVQLSSVEAITTQAREALTQAQRDQDIAVLNRQLAILEHTRSNLIAIVGHELRTPLSTIQICLESLASEPMMESQYRQVMLEIALNDVERLRQLIQDFLTLSRLEHGQVYNRPESLDLQQALDLVLSGLKNKPEQEQLPQIKVELPPQLPPIKADGDKLVEVLSKLIDNACKFTAASGEVKIQALLHNFEVDAIQASVPPPMLEVIVADTGRGIAPSQLEAIFNYFYQEENALQRTAGGTGIGLAICRQIIQGMGGKIWATSAGKKQGSCFHFTIPIVK